MNLLLLFLIMILSSVIPWAIVLHWEARSDAAAILHFVLVFGGFGLFWAWVLATQI